MQDEVKVTQADREAAYGAYFECYDTAPNDLWLQAMLEGRHDEDSLIQVLARHRHQAERDALARIEWRDIESAPKDGGGVLMIDMTAPTPEASTAYFYEDKWWLLAEGDRSREDGAWAYNCPWYANPTHWMPLPPAPEAG